ncbi:MAG: CotH kinase family protein [Deltaproteobacteria bacterium]|nr:CotH kinase family protein [Deltaproteobacteria bacterium]
MRLQFHHWPSMAAWLVLLGCGAPPAQTTALDASSTDADLVTASDAATSSDDAGRGDAGVDPSAELFETAALPRFDLQLSEEAIASLRTDPFTYVIGRFEFEEEVMEEVNVRLKGRTSFQSIDEKPSFKVRFDRPHRGQRFRGLRGLVWNNCAKDPSCTAERLAFRVFRAAGVPAPRCGNARVYVNGEYYGVYADVEPEDEAFLSRWWADASGNLYESEFGDLDASSAQAFELETNKAVNDRRDLRELSAAIDQVTPETVMGLDSLLNMDELLRMWAVEAAVGQRDGYAFLLWGDDVPGNFRLYHDPLSSQFQLIPWSLDRAMKPPHLSPFTSYSRIPFACLAGASCRQAFRTHVAAVADLWESLPLLAEANAIRDQIRPWVELDSRRSHDMAAFDSAVAGVLSVVTSRPAELRADLQANP